MKQWVPTICLAAAVGLAVGGCTQHTVKVEPIEVKPIYIKADVNIKVDRELDSFFDFEKELRPDLQDDTEGGQQ